MWDATLREATRVRGGAPRRFVRSRDGAAAVEFALVLPLFLVLVLGAMDLGRIFFTINALGAAAQQAGRYAMINPRTVSCDAAIADLADDLAAAMSLPAASAAVATRTATIAGAVVTVTDITLSVPVTLTGFLFGGRREISETYTAPRPEPPATNPPTSCLPL